MNNQRKIIWPGGETEKPRGYQMSTRLKVRAPGCASANRCPSDWRCDAMSVATNVSQKGEVECLESENGGLNQGRFYDQTFGGLNENVTWIQCRSVKPLANKSLISLDNN